MYRSDRAPNETPCGKAVSEGHHDFVAIAVTARQGHGAPPCGSCRQVLHEFSPKTMVYWRDARGRIIRRRLDSLLPLAFRFPERRREKLRTATSSSI